MPGVLINETNNLASSLVSVPSAVIAIVGTAPIGEVNEITLLQSASQDSVFGLEVQGFTIPKALKAIRANEPNAKVMVVNVADDVHGVAHDNVQVTNEAHTLVAGATQLTYAPEGAIVVKDTTLLTTYTLTTDYTISATGAFARNPSGAIGATDEIKVTYQHLPNYTYAADKATLSDPPYRSSTPVVYSKTKTTTYVAGTDYNIDAYGVVRRVVGGSMTAAQEFVVEYDIFDGISASDIVGTATPATGIYQFTLAYSTFGFNPTIWICPDYTDATVLTAFRSAINNIYGGVFILDAPQGLTVAQVETARGAGSGNILDVSDQRVVAVYPEVYVDDIATAAEELRPLSPFIAGMLAKVDRLESPGRTLGNYPAAVLGFKRLAQVLTFDPDKSLTTDCSRLNDVDMVTIRTSNIVWGDRSTSYRDDVGVKNKYNVRRVADILKRSIVVGANQFIGQNITKVLIDAILQNGQAYIDTLKQQGWLLDGRMIFNEADNPPSELALGNLTIGFSYVPLLSLDTLTYNFTITTEGITDILGL